ncbi:hypothetical protein TNCV_1439661 [Trichonephila clavipes]|nr:hypothetical protein TNCV_1439661 [Trichonephila clavipes]
MKNIDKCWRSSQVGKCITTFIARALLQLWERLDLRFRGIILSRYFFYTSKKYSGRGSQVPLGHDWPCHEFDPITPEDPPSREAMHVYPLSTAL